MKRDQFQRIARAFAVAFDPRMASRSNVIQARLFKAQGEPGYHRPVQCR